MEMMEASLYQMAVHQAVEDPWGSEFGAIGHGGVGMCGYSFCEATMECDDLTIVI